MDTNFTLIGQLIQIIEHITFLPVEAAVHQFSTYLLISFDPVTQFQSLFFKLCVIMRAIYLKCWKACKLSQFYAASKKTQNWSKVVAEKWVAAGRFFKIFKKCPWIQNSSYAIL